MRRWLHAVVLLLAAVASALALARAQAQERGIVVAPDEDLIEQIAPEVAVDRTPVLPPMPPTPETPNGRRLSGAPVMVLADIRVDDNTVLSAAEIDAVKAEFVGRRVSVEELEELRRRLSMLYFDKGYVNSGLVLPDQQVRDNVVHFREIRGELTAIRLSGNRQLRDNYIVKRIARPGDGPLEINALQTSLQLLERDPMIGRIDAQLLPGSARGEGILRLEIEENRPWQLVTRMDNYRSPGVGGEQASLMVRNRSLLGRGDELRLFASFADGLSDAFASYTLPLNARGTQVEVYGSTADSDIIEGPFERIDIESETGAYGLKLSQVFSRSLTSRFSGFLGGEIKRNINTLLGRRFTFTHGERNGRTAVTAVYTGLEYAKRFDANVIAVRGSVRRGIYRAGATRNRVEFGLQSIGPDGQFTSMQLQGQYLRNLEFRNSSFIARVSLQRAWHPLMALERMPVGGFSTVRGYRENLLVRDNAFVGSIEYQLPLFDLSGPAATFDARRLKLAVFADYGAAWNEAWEFEPDDSKQELLGVGLGLLWNPSASINASLHWGHALNDDVPTGNDSLQDRGIHLSFSWTPLQ